MLSFIFLADGPCCESSWRVHDDKGQWWSRRDALVRIASASMWQTAGMRSDVAGDSCFLFGQQSGEGSAEISNVEFCRPVIVHSSQALANFMPVPTERNLIKVWKDSCGAAEKANAEIGVGRWPLSLSSGVLCSFHPWKEMLLTARADTGSATSGKGSLAGSFDHSKLDKRELLKLLQQSCPVEFLRQHGLNGSEALILKKKNRDAISAAYEAWLAQNARPTADEGKVTTSSDNTAKSATYEKLLNTCKVLLKGILCRFYKTNDLSKISNTSTVGSLLLLHEDYPHELPVFSESHNVRAGEGPVVCAMGAVRDATDEEVCALIEAAVSLNMRCVGANLGRTAEFTSKIVTALVSHAKEGRLQHAVSVLPAVDTHTRGAAVSKLAPQRAGAWSWDGESNKHKNKSSGKRKLDALSEDTSTITPGSAAARTIQHHMHIVAWLHIDVSAVTDDLDRRESMLGLVQLIVTSLWRSRLASEAAHDQSKDSTEPSTKGSKTSENEEDPVAVPKVVPVLHLVFKDGRVATLTQAKLAITMANQHMAAPSEYQVLQMLLSLLRDPAVLTTPPSGESGDTAGVCGVLAHVLPQGLRKSDRKAVRVVELTDTAPVSHVSAHTSFGGKTNFKPAKATSEPSETSGSASLGESLAKYGYAGACGCGADAHGVEGGDVHVVVLINRTMKQTSPSLKSLSQALFCFVYPDKEVPTEEGKVEKKVADMVYRGALFSPQATVTLTAPSIAITGLQHFAYHDRLYPAIELAIAKHKVLDK